ncbi:MAG: ABC transporter ATP-binding protein [Alphaproteobacteria bacterium]|nr:ABC transporter ATP-binding protein [Alphaproteobacteria bacterium]
MNGLTVNNLSLFYGDAQALDDVSIHVNPGEIVSIIGANGAGKTSLIRTIAGMLQPASGSIRLAEKDITGLPSFTICNLGIAQVAEGRQIFPSLTVLENLRMGALIPRARRTSRETLERIFELYPLLLKRSYQKAGSLSGGEQQMLAIGRCLMGYPELIMFDEPSLGLAPAIIDEVFDTICNLNKQGLSILLVEQNVVTSLKLADRAYVLENGRIVLSGNSDQILHDDRVKKAYIGL